MTVSRFVTIVVLLCCAYITFGLAHAQQSVIPVSDLGTREQGQTYPLKLTAQNIDCETAQNFEFEIDSTPWLVTPGGTSVPGLGPGQKKSIPAQLDFTYIPPGIYYSHITARCTSCGWFIFAACVENGQDVILKVKVADPADPTNGANIPEPPNPYAGFQPYQPSLIVLNPPITADDFALLTDKQKRKLREARAAVKAAEAQGVNARGELKKARKIKSDCERELARLKAAMDAANRAAATAKQDAANAQGAADAVAKALADFEKDKAKALKEIDDTMRATLVASKYRGIVASEDGTGSQRYKNAQDQVDRFNEKHFDALRKHTAISKSHAARKQAAAEAKRLAAAAKAKAAQAQAKANAATAAYNAKARECAGLSALKKSAEVKLAAAKAAAEKAVKDANKAERKAEDQAVAAIPDEIDRLKKQKKDCENEVKKYAKYLTRMFKAVRDLTAVSKRKITDKDLNVEVTAADMAKEFAKSVATNVAGEAVPFDGGMAFDTLEAAYGIIAIKQQTNTPGRGLFRGQDHLADTLKRKGHAKNGAEAKRMAADMEKFIVTKNGKADIFRAELKDKILRCMKIGREIAKLEARQKAAKKGKR